jgi:hypothetical protein
MPPVDYKKYYIDHKDIINTRSKKRYVENKESLLEYHHKRYEEKKQEILKRQKIKTKCECGSTYNRSRKKRHIRTNKHLKYLESLTSSIGCKLVNNIDKA